MIYRTQLSEADARYAVEHGEFPEHVRAATDSVAVVMTQGWCPQWFSMKVWLANMERKKRPKDYELTVFELVYDMTDFFEEFLAHKERYWGNIEIPYIRYYRDGKLVATSNYVPSRTFLTYAAEGAG
jgi:hypothetical protein